MPSGPEVMSGASLCSPVAYVALAMPRGLITPIDVSNWKAGKASVNHRFPSSPAVIPTPPLVPVGSWNTVIPPVEAPTFGASAKARVRMAYRYRFVMR